MRIEVIGNESPMAGRVEGNEVPDVFQEIFFVASWLQQRGEDLSGGDVEIAEQAESAVTRVFLLPPRDVTGSRQ